MHSIITTTPPLPPPVSVTLSCLLAVVAQDTGQRQHGWFTKQSESGSLVVIITLTPQTPSFTLAHHLPSPPHPPVLAVFVCVCS